MGSNKNFLDIPVLVDILVTTGSNKVTVPMLRMNPDSIPAPVINNNLIPLGRFLPNFNSHFATIKLIPEFSRPKLIIIIAIKEITAWLEKPENNSSGGKILVTPIITKTNTATTSVLKVLEKNNTAVMARISKDKIKLILRFKFGSSNLILIFFIYIILIVI